MPAEAKALGFLAFARYSLESVLRNGKRSLYAIIGIVIALSLIAGSWIAVDSSGLGLLRAEINEVPVDFVGGHVSGSTTGSDDAMNVTATVAGVLESVEGVEEVTPIISVSSPCYMNSNGSFYLGDDGLNFSGSLVFLPNSTDHLLDSFKIAGDLPSPGTVAIPKDVADSLDLEVGDEITCVFERVKTQRLLNGTVLINVTYLNITSPISGIWTQEGFENISQYDFDDLSANKRDSEIWLRLVRNPVIFDLADYARLGIDRSGLNSTYTVGWDYFIWVDRSEFIRLANVPASIDKLRAFQHQLDVEMYSYDVAISRSDLISPLLSLQSELQERKPLFLAFSLPVIALGVYLSVVGVDLSVTERRREAGILKSRGASDRQVFSSLVVEALALGAISGFSGLLLGVFVSRLLLGDIAGSEGEADTNLTDFLFSSSTIVLCILLGIALMLLSSYGPFKRVSGTRVGEALHHYSPTATRVEYWARSDIALLSLCVLSIVTILVGADWPQNQGWSWIVEFLVSTLFFVGIALFPLLPFMLSFSVVRLLTMGSRRIYSKITWLVKPWTKDLHYLINRNIVRNPRRSSNLCLIISLALAFGLFISVTMESTIRYEREQVRFDVGSDIKLDASYVGTVNQSAIDLPTPSDLATLPGVEHAATYSVLDLGFKIFGDTRGTSSAVLNSTDYLETVRPSGFFFIDGGDGLLEELSVNGTVLLTKDFASQFDLSVGDPLPVVLQYYTVSEFFISRFDVIVAGFVKGLPGLPGVNVFMDRESLSFIPDEKLAGAFHSNGAFLDLIDGTDPHEVVEDAAGLYASPDLSFKSAILEDRLDALKDDPAFGSLVGFLYMEYALSIVIMTMGVGLLTFVAVHDREKELACIMARGSSGGQLRKILMGESISLMALGVVVGSSVGILTAYIFNTVSSGDITTVVEREMVFTYVSLSIVLASVIALIVASLIATSRAGKIRLAEVLRIRGG